MVLFTGYKRSEIERLGEEAINCAVLDAACTSTVCGTRWMQCFLDGFSERDRENVTTSEGHKVFKFGGGEQLKSQMSCQLPGRIAGKDIIIEVDVVDSAIPTLLSLKSLKKAKAKLNLERDTEQLFGTEVPLSFTTSGHYCIPVDRKVGVKVDEVCNTVLSELQQPERKNAILKLHKPFAHPSMPQCSHGRCWSLERRLPRRAERDLSFLHYVQAMWKDTCSPCSKHANGHQIQ